MRPGLDDKRLTAWNALMISALADAGAVLERPDYLEAAVACAEFVLRDLRDADGRLLRTYNRGQGRLGAYLEDHAFLLEALLTLYEASFDPRWFHAARELADTLLERFADRERGGFFATADDHERLVARRKELEDAPIPSGASAAAFGLLRLAALTGELRYEEAALGAINLLHTVAPQHPVAFAHLLCAIDFHVGPCAKSRWSARDRAARAGRALRVPPAPRAGRRARGRRPAARGRGPVGGRAAAYVCERFACRRAGDRPGGARDAARASLMRSHRIDMMRTCTIASSRAQDRADPRPRRRGLRRPGAGARPKPGSVSPNWLRGEAARLAARPSVAEWLKRTDRRTAEAGRAEALAALEEQRGPWPDAGG